jgi:hypothetical protein
VVAAKNILKTIARLVPIIKTFCLILELNWDAAMPIITALSAERTKSIKMILIKVPASSKKNIKLNDLNSKTVIKIVRHLI